MADFIHALDRHLLGQVQRPADIFQRALNGGQAAADDAVEMQRQHAGYCQRDDDHGNHQLARGVVGEYAGVPHFFYQLVVVGDMVIQAFLDRGCRHRQRRAGHQRGAHRIHVAGVCAVDEGLQCDTVGGHVGLVGAQHVAIGLVVDMFFFVGGDDFIEFGVGIVVSLVQRRLVGQVGEDGQAIAGQAAGRQRTLGGIQAGDAGDQPGLHHIETLLCAGKLQQAVSADKNQGQQGHGQGNEQALGNGHGKFV